MFSGIMKAFAHAIALREGYEAAKEARKPMSAWDRAVNISKMVLGAAVLAHTAEILVSAWRNR